MADSIKLEEVRDGPKGGTTHDSKEKEKSVNFVIISASRDYLKRFQFNCFAQVIETF